MAANLSAEDLENIASQVATKIASSSLAPKKSKKGNSVAWERFLVLEYCLNKYPNNLKWIRCEVGAYSIEGNARIYSRIRRWADAIIKRPDDILIIEAKMRAQPSAVAQVWSYMQDFPQTPEFREWKDMKVTGMVLTAMDSQDTKKACDEWGIDYEVFVPSNYETWHSKYILKK